VRDTLAIVLAGGEGRRLYPLTRERAKPAVHFGGNYRLVDFVLSNLVNSGVRRIRVLTQYRASSLVQHIARWWPLAANVAGEYIECIPASMNLGPTWFRGTADAIYQNLNLIQQHKPDVVAVFGADHVYRMDIRQMLTFHREHNADVTVAALPVPVEQASAFARVMLLPREWRGKRTIRYVDPADAARPRLQQARVYFDVDVAL